MNILIVSSYLPYPLINGGNIRLFNLIKHISKKHKITLICELRPYQTSEDVKELENYCMKVIPFPREKQWSIKNILNTGFSMNSFLVTGHTNNKLATAVENELQSETYDLIHVETFYVMHNIPDTQFPIILTEHNIEYMVYKRFVDRSPVLIRPLLYLDIIKLQKNEKDAWKRAEKLIAVSGEDKRYMEREDVYVVPNGVDLDSFDFKQPSPKKYHSIARHMNLPEKEILFIGDFKWMQNRDAVSWIITDIWPYLLRAVEGEVKIRLRVVGKNIPESIKSMNTFDSIEFDENASIETVEIYKKADILLTPVRIAGGTSYKILEAMATGVPVVTTTLGIKGFEAVAGMHAIAVDDVQTLVEKTARLLRDDELYTQIAQNARKLIEEKYDWNIIAETLEQVYESVKK